MIVNRDYWDRFKRLLQSLRPWVEPSSYRPLWALVVVSLGVFLAPPGFRCLLRALLQTADVVQVCARERTVFSARRIWPLAPVAGEARGFVAEPRERGRPGSPIGGSTLAALGASVGRFVAWFPYHAKPRWPRVCRLGFRARQVRGGRRTILIWGQFPWWNPWVPRRLSAGGRTTDRRCLDRDAAGARPGDDHRPSDCGDPLVAHRRGGDVPAGVALVSRTVGCSRHGPHFWTERGGNPDHFHGLRPGHELL